MINGVNPLGSVSGQVAGPPGKSAYDVWVANGGVGSASVFLASLVGPPGASGAPSIVPGPSGGAGPAGPVAWAPAVAWSQAIVCVSSAPATVVVYNGIAYVCAVNHVANVFASDLGAGYWLQITTGGVPGATGGTGATSATGPTGPQPWKTPPVAWAASKVYSATAPADSVTYSGSSYVCSTAHTSGASFDATKWTQIAAAGTLTQAPPVFECRLVYTSTSLVTLLPWQGNQISINGTYYTIPNAGVTVGPSGSVGAVMAVYATPNGASVSLLLSATQPSLGNYGSAILGTDETKVHVGDVLIQSGTAFANFNVVSRYNKIEAEIMSANVSQTTSNTTASVTNSGWNIGCLVASGEPVQIEIVGAGYNYAGSSGNVCYAQPFMSVNGSTLQSPFPAYSPGNVGTQCTMYQRARSIASSTQAVTGSVNHWSSNSGTTAFLSGNTIIRTKQ